MSISFITPSYNQGRFIESTIISVLSQNVQDFEYVVYDNLSNDQTPQILKKYAPYLNWISELDHGQAHAVNKGIRNTTGEIIAWINSDDIYYPNAIQKVIEHFEVHPEVDVIYGDADHIDEQGHKIEAYYTEPWDLEKLQEVCFLCQPATFFRRRVVEKFGFLDEELQYCMDYEYWLRIGHGGAIFSYLSQTLAGSRLHSDTKTLGNKIQFHSEINDMFIKLFGEVPDKWLFNYAHAILDTWGFPRSNKTYFAILISLVSIWAAFKWNHRVSSDMIKTLIR